MRARDVATFVTLTILISVILPTTSVTAGKKMVGLDARVQALDFPKDVPDQLNYQGFLVNATDSSAVTATLEMIFRLFDSETKGAELWSETHPAVEVSNGLFQVLLGSITPFPDGLFDGSPLWLQTEVGAEVLSPRKPLVSVAYSQRAEETDYAVQAGNADRLESQTLTDLDALWVNEDDLDHLDAADGDPADAVCVDADGKVGVGTTSPLTELDVNGAVNATTYYGDGSNLTGIAGTPDADWTVSGNHMYSAVPGSVGIGTSSPENRLHIAGDVKATTYYGDGSNLTGISGTTDNDWTISGDDVYHQTGNVGIGTTSPTAPLTIQTIPGTDVEFSSSGSNADMVASGQFNIGTSGIQNLHLMTGYLTRMCVTGTGQVGVGTTSPTQQLDVNGAINATTYYGDGSNLTGISSPPDSDWTISGDHVYHETGNVGIGTTDPILGRLEAVGFTCPGVYGASNDYAGVLGSSSNAQGVLGISTSGHAGYFLGHVYIHGNTGIGEESPAAKLDVKGDINADSLYKLGGSPVLSAEGSKNLFVGIAAGENNSGALTTCVGDSAGFINEGHANTFVGGGAGRHNTTGSYNTFLGRGAGYFNTEGEHNIFIGNSAGVWNEWASDNTFIGFNAGARNVSGNGNTFIGNNAGHSNTNFFNTFLGDHAGYGTNSGGSNVFIGWFAGWANTSGRSNTYLGTQAGYNNATGIRNVFIGHGAGYNCVSDSNKLHIANGPNDSDVLIYGDFLTDRIGLGTLAPAERLHLHKDSESLGIRISSDASSYQYINFGATNGYGIGCDANDRFFLNREEPLGTGVLRILTILADGKVGIGTSSPTEELHVIGDIYCTGKLTSVGGNDPPYVLYNKESREAIIDRVATEVPEEKQGGAVLFWNGGRKRFEVYLPEDGEFRDLDGNLLSTVGGI